MAAKGEVRFQVSKPTDPVPAGHVWKKVGESKTPLTTGGSLITPKWQVVAVKSKGKFPVVFVVGVIATVIILGTLRGR